MIFEASRAKAVDKLNHFIENNLSAYSKLRNFDFGPDNRSNISCLSPYISHGIINELEVIDKSLKKFSFTKNEKFIQEVLWRTYWKGWLELRPNVWSDYLINLNNLNNEFKNKQNYVIYQRPWPLKLEISYYFILIFFFLELIYNFFFIFILRFQF